MKKLSRKHILALGGVIIIIAIFSSGSPKQNTQTASVAKIQEKTQETN